LAGDELGEQWRASLCASSRGRRALELLATAFDLPAGYFAEYRLAEFRRQLDERDVGFATAYRSYRTLIRRAAAASRLTTLAFR
jgi:hypothetical protein